MISVFFSQLKLLLMKTSSSATGLQLPPLQPTGSASAAALKQEGGFVEGTTDLRGWELEVD